MPVHQQDETCGALRVRTLTLEQGPHNILDLSTCEQLLARLEQTAREQSCTVVVLRGAGASFSTGMAVHEHTPEAVPQLLECLHALVEALFALHAVTLTAVHGCCLGGAAELALCTDRVLAWSTARIGFPEIGLGCFPPVALAVLPQRIGHGRAAEMILAGQEIPVATLRRWGLVHEATAATPHALEAAVRRYIQRLSGHSPAVLGMTARLLHDATRRNMMEQLSRFEAFYRSHLLAHPDAQEGLAAFLGKRKPLWKT